LLTLRRHGLTTCNQAPATGLRRNGRRIPPVACDNELNTHRFAVVLTRVKPQTRGRSQPRIPAEILEERTFIWGLIAIALRYRVGSPLSAAEASEGVAGNL
jgi:hypothetical protein